MELSKICNFVPEASSHFRILIHRAYVGGLFALSGFSPSLLHSPGSRELAWGRGQHVHILHSIIPKKIALRRLDERID